MKPLKNQRRRRSCNQLWLPRDNLLKF